MCNFYFIGLYMICWLIYGCQQQKIKEKKIIEESVFVNKTIPKESVYTDFELRLFEQGFINIKDSLPNIYIMLKYATIDNFTGEILYDSLHHAFLQEAAFKKLKKAQKILQQIDTSLSIVVFDALRPQHVQYKMWEKVKGTNLQRYVAIPTSGSMHNYGCAVDVSIIKNGNTLLDMGTSFDHFGDLSQPRYNQRFIKEGKLIEEQVKNRQLLRNTMLQAGFNAINTEWWHFNAFSKEYIRSHYKPVL